MESIATRLLESREKKGLTQKRLSEIVGVNKLTVCHWEKGRRSPSRHAVALSKALGISERWLMTGEDNAPSIKTVPLLRYVAAGRGAPIDPSNAKNRTTDFSGGADFALEVFGDAMEPSIQHGDIVYMQSAEVEFEPLENAERAEVPASVVKSFDKKIVVVSLNGDWILQRLEIVKKQGSKCLCKFVNLNKGARRVLKHGDDCRIKGVTIGIWRTYTEK